MKGLELGRDSHINRGITVADDFLGVWACGAAVASKHLVLMAFRKIRILGIYGKDLAAWLSLIGN